MIIVITINNGIKFAEKQAKECMANARLQSSVRAVVRRSEIDASMKVNVRGEGVLSAPFAAIDCKTDNVRCGR
jgi:metal-sulfur cluster biosynthetic enzyme